MKRKIIYPVFFLLCLLIGGGALFLRQVINELPPIDRLESYVPNLTTRVLDHKGRIISEFYTERRVWMQLKDIPVDLQNSFISVEDDRFFEHYGISIQGTLRAAILNFAAGRVRQGGSTITQQLSKLIFLTRERTFKRKIKELLLSLQIENRFSKQEILQMYLNQVYFGHGAYGAAAAAKIFFGKPVQNLNLEECALLAGLPRLPTYYSPFRHPERAKARRAVVLNRLQELGYITKEEEARAKAAPLGVGRTPLKERYAPYFIEWIRQDLENKYGSETLYHGGLTIYTTLDLELQKIAEVQISSATAIFDKTYGALAAELRLQEQKDNFEKLKKENPDKSFPTPKFELKISSVQAAFVAIDVHTGAVRAMVGGRDFYQSQFNRALQAKRQPGSAFKPFVWLSALENGFTVASQIDDSPLLFKNNGNDWELLEEYKTRESIESYLRQAENAANARGEKFDEKKYWSPVNYNGKYLGSITLRRALATSRNTTAVRLIDKLGASSVVEMAHRLGIKSDLDAVRALALGSSVVNLLEITSAFSVFPAQGVRAEPYTISKITDHSGRVLEENFPQQKAVLDAPISYLMVQLLRAVVLEGTGVYARNAGVYLGGKTGTSQDYRDGWFIGFTPEIAFGAWVGYDDFSQLGRKMASSVVTVPWWTEIVREYMKDKEIKDFSVPSGIEFVEIDKRTGKLAAPGCPLIISEAFISGSAPKEVCKVNHTSESQTEETDIDD